MYKILIKPKVHSKLNFFIDGFRIDFLNRFLDTGLVNEKLILERYEKKVENFYEEILLNINYKFKKDLILGYFIYNDKKGIYITLDNYRLKIYYTEIKKDNIRIIDNIEFHKK